MSTDNKNPLMVQPKKKRHLWGLWIPLIVIFSLVIVPIGVAAALFYDPSHYDTGITKKEDPNTMFASMMTDMFDGCRNEEPTIDLKLTQKALNQLLYNVSESMTPEAKNYLKQFAIRITDDSYVFDLEIGAFNILKTHLTLTTKIQVNAVLGTDGSGNEIRGFLFEITNLKVGRLGGLQGMLPWISSTAGLDLTDILKGAGLSIMMDIDNLRMTYTYDDFVKDLSDKAGSGDPLFLNIFSNFFKENHINFTHHADVDVTGSISMAPFLTNGLYTNSDYAEVTRPLVGENHDIPLLNYTATQVESMIDNGIIEKNGALEDHARTVHKFMSYGMTSNSAEDAYIDSIYNSIKATYCNNLSKDDYATAQHNLVFGDDSQNVMNKITSEVTKKITAMSDSGELTTYLTKVVADGKAYIYDDANPLVVYDYEIQDMLKDNDQLIGYGFSFIGNYANGNAKLSYAMLDTLYPTVLAAKYDENTSEKLSSDMMALTFGLNINGAKTSLILPMEGEEIHVNNKHGLSFSLSEAPLYFGTETFPALKDQLQHIMNGISSSEGDTIQFVTNEQGDLDKIQMVFDFDDYFAENEGKGDPFTEFHKTATGSLYKAKLVVDFDFVQSSSDATGKRAGQFNVKVGYEKTVE